MVAVGADRHILAAELRIRPGKNGNHVAARRGRRPRVPQIRRHRLAHLSLRQAGHRCTKNRLDDGIGHQQDRRSLRSVSCRRRHGRVGRREVLDQRGRQRVALQIQRTGGPGERGTKGLVRSRLKYLGRRPRTRLEENQLAGNAGGIERCEGIGERSGEDNRDVRVMFRARSVDRDETAANGEHTVADRQRRRRVESRGPNREVLIEAAVRSARLQPHPPDFTLDICHRLQMVRRADIAPHHRIVSVLVQPGHQVARRDRRDGGRSDVLERQRSTRGLGAKRSGERGRHREPTEPATDIHTRTQHRVGPRRWRNEAIALNATKTPA